MVRSPINPSNFNESSNLSVYFEQSLKVRSEMAKAGASSKVTASGTKRSANTRKALIDSTIETLRVEGFSGASTRAISDRAGLNQGLVFYHFGSVVNLLLAALDTVSEIRMKKYSAAIEQVSSPSEIMNIATQIFKDDLNTGYVTVLDRKSTRLN